MRSSRGSVEPINCFQYTAMSYCYSTGTYNQYPSHYRPQFVQSFSSSANVEQGEFLSQKFPPLAAPIDFLNWDDFFLTPSATSGSVAQVSATLPIQTNSLSTVPLLSCSYLDIVANNSRALPVAAPVPILHATLTKAALRSMMSFEDKGNIYRIPLTKKLNWHGRYLQDKENVIYNNSAGGHGSEHLNVTVNDARITRVDFDNHRLPVNSMNCNALVNSVNSNQTATGVVTGRSKLVIRPISPSTLMALTEPCLMDWCTALDDESLVKPCPSADLPLQISDHSNFVDKKNKTVCNAWGY